MSKKDISTGDSEWKCSNLLCGNAVNIPSDYDGGWVFCGDCAASDGRSIHTDNED